MSIRSKNRRKAKRKTARESAITVLVNGERTTIEEIAKKLS